MLLMYSVLHCLYSVGNEITIISTTRYTTTGAECKSESTKDTPYLTQMGELLGVFCEYLGENWLCYNGTTLYFASNPYRLNIISCLSVREITKSSSTFSATNISSNMIWFFSTAWYNQNEIKSYRNQL